MNKPQQQGDVLLNPINELPQGEQKFLGKSKVTVAHGESGHTHVVIGDVELIEINNLPFLKVNKTATITHEEHKQQTIEPGIWEIGRVQEYDWFQKMQRSVID